MDFIELQLFCPLIKDAVPEASCKTMRARHKAAYFT